MSLFDSRHRSRFALAEVSPPNTDLNHRAWPNLDRKVVSMGGLIVCVVHQSVSNAQLTKASGIACTLSLAKAMGWTPPLLTGIEVPDWKC